MTYPSFTRPLWAWLSDPQTTSYRNAEGDEVTEPWFFGQPIGGIPRYTAAQFVDSVTRFAAGVPWRVRLGTMQPLDTHDTARFATHAGEGTIPVAVGLSMTLPGLPVVYAGDEFGAVGVDGEASRTPMPWGTEGEPAVAERIALYRDLVHLRRAHPALAGGGLRWVHVDEDAVLFVREAADETILVLAARGDVEMTVPADALAGAEQAQALYGAAAVDAASGVVTISARGPVFAVWALPGVRMP